MTKPLKKIEPSKLYYFLNGKKVMGANSTMSGDCSGLRGDCTMLWGDCSGLKGDCTGLRGDCSGLKGNCTGLRGDCTGLKGNCTGLQGNLNEISTKQRKENPDIRFYAEEEGDDQA